MARLLLAFAKAREVKEAVLFNKYLGCVTAHLEAINPTKEQLNKLLGRAIPDSAVNYTSEIDVTDINGKIKKGKQNKLTFWYSFENPLEESGKSIISHSIFFSNGARTGSRTGKIQVCDKYGRFAWATPEEYKGGVIPQYRSGAANISKQYRCAVNGEEEVIELIKCHLGMKLPVERLTDGTFRNLTEEELENNASDFCACFEPQDIIAICNGNVSVIKNEIMNANDVKLILSVRHSDKGDYQGVYAVKRKDFTNLASIEREFAKSPIKNTIITIDGHIPAAVVKYEPTPTDITKNKGAEVDMPQTGDDDMPF